MTAFTRQNLVTIWCALLLLNCMVFLGELAIGDPDRTPTALFGFPILLVSAVIYYTATRPRR